MYSCMDAAEKGIGWMRAGSDISYYSNPFVRNNSAGEGLACYYTLSFTMEFHNPRDTYLIAYSYPYTLSDYKSHMMVLSLSVFLLYKVKLLLFRKCLNALELEISYATDHYAPVLAAKTVIWYFISSSCLTLVLFSAVGDNRF